MPLFEEDEAYLAQKKLAWELIPGPAESFLLLHNYPLAPGRFDRETVTLMVRIPVGYNIAGLDMFYVDPSLRLKNGSYPEAASHFEQHAGRTWQRFSRHLNTIPWRPGIDRLPGFLILIAKELQ